MLHKAFISALSYGPAPIVTYDFMSQLLHPRFLSGSIFIIASPFNVPLFVLSVDILLYTCRYLKTTSLFIFILAWSRPFCYNSSLGPTLIAKPLAFMVLLSIIKSLIITSALMLHVDVFHDGNTIATCPIKTFCAIQVLHHIILSPESLLHTILQFTSTLMSISPRGTKENPPIS